MVFGPCPLSFSQQVARTERAPSLNRNGFIRIEGGAAGGYGESRGCFVAETSFYDYHRGRRKSSSYIPVSFRVGGSRFVFRPSRSHARGGGSMRQRWGIYVLYVHRPGSITDTREILTRDKESCPRLISPLMNGNGINKWCYARFG